MIGETMPVLVDGVGADGRVAARHAGQAPMVDSLTYVSDCGAEPGEFVEVRCTGRSDYDLIAVPTRVALPVMSR
jgi:tRNA A37 methylthiotransferase MiaB